MSILSFVSDALMIDKVEMMMFAQTAPHRYKKYFINKRNGAGVRLIAQPSKETKFIQRVVLSKLREILPVHRCAMAYEKSVGIKLNAMHHKDGRYLLKMDFRDFFPSVMPNMFLALAKDCGVEFSDEDKEFLSRILFFRSTRKSLLRLSIGAPTSPFISNFIMYKFDVAMAEYCQENGINYTRYADDVTFSSNVKGILFDVPDIVKKNLRQYCYGQIKINPLKTIFSSKAFNRHVTGIVINNDSSLSLGREKKRIYSSMIHKFSLGLMDEKERERLKGFLAYTIYIEPDFIERMKKKYSSDLIAAIML